MGKAMRTVGLGAGMAAIAAVVLWSMADRVRGAVGQIVPHPAATASAGPVPPLVLGMNLGVPTYYSAEWAFSDLIKNNADFTWEGQQPQPGLLDAGGWPHRVPKGKVLLLAIDVANTWRVGRYECRISPGWSVESRFRGYGSVSQKGEHFTLDIPERTPGYAVHLALRAEADGANLDVLACLPAGAPAALLSPAFVADMAPFHVIRFMDWMRTNNGAPTRWAARALPGDISLVPRGASVEDMVAVADRLGADPWFTLPFQADAEYVRSFATYVRDHLAPGRKAYVELSNEVWNLSFQQAKDALAAGKARYPDVSDQKAADYLYADRVRETMAIWSQVFAGQTKRIVRVAASQHAWSQRAEDILSHGDTWRSVDALATAPYFGTPIQDIVEQGAGRVDREFARLPGQIEQSVAFGVENKAVADRHGLRYITYEGGPDVLGFTPDARTDAEAIVHDPRLYQAYRDFLRKWQARVGGLMVLYDSAGASTYSHKDYTGQPLKDAPKMRALVDLGLRS